MLRRISQGLRSILRLMEKHVENYNPDWETREIREARKKAEGDRVLDEDMKR